MTELVFRDNAYAKSCAATVVVADAGQYEEAGSGEFGDHLTLDLDGGLGRPGHDNTHGPHCGRRRLSRMAEILVWVLIVAAVAVGVGALVALWRTLAGLKRLQGERE